MICNNCGKSSSYDLEKSKNRMGLIGVVLECGCYISIEELSPKLDGKCTVEGFNRVYGGNKT